MTASNATIAIQQENFNNMEIGCGTYPLLDYISTLISTTSCPVWLGVFYTDDDGDLKCGGYTEWNSTQSFALAAWGDDPTTPEKDGFSNQELYIFKLCLNGEESGAIEAKDSSQIEMSTDTPFSDSYFTNGFGNILSLFYESSYYCSDIVECNIDLKEYSGNNELVKTVDLYGREVNTDKNSGFMIQIYSDQTVSKTYKF